MACRMFDTWHRAEWPRPRGLAIRLICYHVDLLGHVMLMAGGKTRSHFDLGFLVVRHRRQYPYTVRSLSAYLGA